MDSTKIDPFVQYCQQNEIPIYTPGAPEYERSVATSNLLYRYSRPDYVVQPRNDGDVIKIVVEAKSRQIPIIIKNGGHSYSGFSTTNKGISLDLVRMKEVTLDIDNMMVTLEGGALWGHAYKKLVNGRHDGFVINGGRCPTVGVSGFVLGGGLGPFTRSFGMGCDTLEEVSIVTASGDLVTVTHKDMTENPHSDRGRLFWAICGAGGGNFGVVVKLKMRVQKLANEKGKVVAGRYEWSPNRKDSRRFFKIMNTFYTADWPKEMTIDTSWVCDTKSTTPIMVRFLVYYDGEQEPFDKIISDPRFIDSPDLSKHLKRRCLVEGSSRFFHETLVSQWSEEIVKSFPATRLFNIYTSFVFKNKPEKIKLITEIIETEMESFRDLYSEEKALLQVTWIHSGGKVNDYQRYDTAYRWRGGSYHAYIMIEWDGKWLEQNMRGFLQGFKDKLKPHSLGKKAVFINFPDGALQEDEYEKSYYGNNYLKLREVKQAWDAGNYFNWSQGVKLPRSEATADPKGIEALTLSTETEDVEESSEAVQDDAETLAKRKHEVVLKVEHPIDEQKLTDSIASEAWRTYVIPPAKDVSEILKTGFVGGVYALDDLGF
ncbi:hypothetical protein TWF694_010878 [Orbilia ellipsospora]|uniref:FAD-binding PCMH-type domain-containing protein n=1 Tax=Orbilia ellipsospora TaxID=2528407 RepID=A0AAV9X8K5_9PEZI